MSARRDVLLDELGAAFRTLLAEDRRLRTRRPGKGGLTWSQFRVLDALDRLGDAVPAGKLAAEAEVTPGSLTQALDQLEELGIARRTRSAEDRRVVVVELTDTGRQRRQEQRVEFREKWRDLWADVDDERLREASDDLERLAALLRGL